MTDRILYNRPPIAADPGEIDELVASNCDVHIEQMAENCWWISLRRADGAEWSGNFFSGPDGKMTFAEQENHRFAFKVSSH